MLRIRKDDNVMVVSGKDKGKSGKVIKVFPAAHRAVVENINIAKKAVKKSEQYPQGGYAEVERPIHISNLMLIDKKSNKPTRISVKIEKDGSKVRIAKKSKEPLI